MYRKEEDQQPDYCGFNTETKLIIYMQFAAKTFDLLAQRILS